MMFALNKLLSHFVAPSQQVVPDYVSDYVQAPAVMPVLVPVEPSPREIASSYLYENDRSRFHTNMKPPSSSNKPKPHRARGPRVVDGVNQAVLRAVAAGCHYLHDNDGTTLKEAAQRCNASLAYTRATLALRLPFRAANREDFLARRALLDAALHGDVPLLTAAYRTNTATNITIVNNI